MLNISRQLKASDAASYYECEDYYLQEAGQWYGGTAPKLGLKGKIKGADFLNLLNGKDRNGEKLVASAGAEDVFDKDGKFVRVGHRSGIDLTFSAPKSVSLLSYIDPRIQKELMKAAEETLSHIEARFAYTQVKDRYGNGSVQKTDNLLWAMFPHATSREFDPHLHCHCVLLNVTEDKNGKMKTGHNDPLYKNQKYFGLVFRTKLVARLKGLGYSIVSRESTDPTEPDDGLFDIGGIDKPILYAFSKRRQQIVEEIERFEEIRESENVRKAKIAENATLKTRKRKEYRPKEEIQGIVERTCEDLGTSLKELANSAKKYTKDHKWQEPDPKPAKDILMNATKIITETKSTFTWENIMEEALKDDFGEYDLEDFETALDELCQMGEISKLGDVSVRAGIREIFSSREMIEIERKIMEVCKNTRGKSHISVDMQRTNDFIQDTDRKLIEESGHGFTPGQKDALRLIASTTDQFAVIQGDAGTGKSFSCLHVKRLLEDQGFKIRGLAPTGKAATGLAMAADIKESDYSTIDSFLIGYRNYKTGQCGQPFKKDGEVWLVDEAGMCGSRKFLELMEAAQDASAKVIFIGDRKQFQSIEAGRMFAELQDKAGIEMVTMKDVIRQKTEQAKEIVKAISDAKDIDLAFDVMSGYTQANINVKTIANYNGIVKAISTAENVDLAFDMMSGCTQGYTQGNINTKSTANYWVGMKLKFTEEYGRKPNTIPARVECNVVKTEDKMITIQFFDEDSRREKQARIDPAKASEYFNLYMKNSTYKNMITEEPDNDKCRQLAVADYINSVKSNKDVLLITGRNKEKDELNRLIRAEFVEQGLITDTDEEFTTLQPKSIGAKDAGKAKSYKGLVIKPNRRSKELDFDTGKVIAVGLTNTITVEVENGGMVEIDVDKHHKNFRAYTEKTHEKYAVGDLIIFLSNERKNIGVNNGETAKIDSIQPDGTVKAKLVDGGKEVYFNLNKGHVNTYQHIDHAYVITDYKSQGATTSRLIWYAPTALTKGGPMSMNTCYVAITRCKEEVGVYTDNINSLREKVKEEQYKESTLDDLSKPEQEIFRKRKPRDRIEIWDVQEKQMPMPTQTTSVSVSAEVRPSLSSSATKPVASPILRSEKPKPQQAASVSASAEVKPSMSPSTPKSAASPKLRPETPKSPQTAPVSALAEVKPPVPPLVPEPAAPPKPKPEEPKPPESPTPESYDFDF